MGYLEGLPLHFLYGQCAVPEEILGHQQYAQSPQCHQIPNEDEVEGSGSFHQVVHHSIHQPHLQETQHLVAKHMYISFCNEQRNNDTLKSKIVSNQG